MEIWTEKYRPQDFDEVIGQEEVVKRIKAMIRQGSIQHLLFAGPAGSGKTTLALIIAKKLYGDAWRENLLELNASDERGIDTIRTKVKDFARTKPLGKALFKIILLDEADALTHEAQHALRRTMENFTSTCRFILDCNYSSKIIDPIQSRCAIFRFRPLKKEEIKEYLKKIAKAENLRVEEAALEAICELVEGDCRKAINLLQSCSALGKRVTEKAVYEIAGFARLSEVREVLELALEGNFSKAKERILDLMIRYGLSGLDAIKCIQKCVWDLEIPEEAKVDLLDKVGEYEFRIVEGSDEFLQMEALLAQFYKLGKEIG
jgi:replication factor C small subunit